MTAVIAAPDLSVAAALRDIRDLELRDRTSELFDRVRASEPSMVVLAARRLACIYATLVEAGMPAFDCPVYSDRDFELIGEDLSGSDIALVDDSLVVGSTLAHLYQLLTKLVGPLGRVQVFVVCVDGDQASPAIMRHLGVSEAAIVDSRRVSDYSHDLARLLFRNLMPYVGDFLVGPRVQVSVADLPAILKMPSWTSADVTSPLVADESTMAYTFMPSPDLEDRAMADVVSYCPSLRDIEILFKVRTYVRVTGFAAELRIVPMAILGDTPVSTIRRAVEGLLGNVKDAILLDILSKPENAASAARVVQAFCASRVGALFVEAFPVAVGIAIPSFIDGALAEMNFGPALQDLVVSVAQLPSATQGPTSRLDYQGPDSELGTPEAITELARERHARTMARLIQEFVHGVGIPARPSEPCTVFPGQVPVGLIGHWFSFVDGAFERPERVKLRDMSWAQFCANYPDPQTRRLNQGITLGALSEMIPGSDRVWARYLASLAIDVCNDTGVAVPATLIIRGRAVRIFRLGENSYLASFPFSYSGDLRSRFDAIAGKDVWLVPRFRTIISWWDANSLGMDPSPDDISDLRNYAMDVRAAARTALGELAGV